MISDIVDLVTTKLVNAVSGENGITLVADGQLALDYRLAR